VIQHAAADDAAADDEHLHVALHGFIFPTLILEILAARARPDAYLPAAHQAARRDS